MKLNICKILATAALASAFMAAAGCTYDDSTLNERLDKVESDLAKLKTIVDNLNSNINALVVAVDAVKNADQITAISELPDGSGYTVTFSKYGTVTVFNGKNGIDGDSPQISVKLDDDGNYYWTVDGEYLTDAEGNKIAATAHIATPQIRINEGNFEISYNNGVTWEIIGSAGNAEGTVIFKDVRDEEEAVTFVLADREIVIPKAQQFVINVDETSVVIKAGESTDVSYTISAADEGTVMDGFGTKGFEVAINARDYSSGTATITAPETLDGKVYLIAVNSKGATAARILSFEEGQLTLDEAALAVKVPAKGGTVEIPVTTNLEYQFYPDPQYGWIQLVETKAIRHETIVLNIDENTSSEERTGQFRIICSALTPPMQIYSIVQEGASEEPGPTPSGGGKADFETFNDGTSNTSTNTTYTTTSGWSTVNCSIRSSSDWDEIEVVAPCLNSSAINMGVLTSPILSDGCGVLSFSYGRYMLGSGPLSILVEIKNESGTTLKSEHITLDSVARKEIKSANINVNVSGNFQIVISGQETGLNYNFVITKLSWTGYTE